MRRSKPASSLICGDSLALLHGLAPERRDAFLERIDGAASRQGVKMCWPHLREGRLERGATLAALRHFLAPNSQGASPGKASVATLGAAMAQEKSAGLTVSAGLAVARRLGAAAFVTGGLGGIHLPLQPASALSDRDVSADLHAIASAHLPLYCAGFKPFIDAPGSLAYLESLGVPVVQIGPGTLPALYANDYGAKPPLTCDSAQMAWAIWRAHKSLGTGSGAVICVSLPQDRAIAPGVLLEATGRELETVAAASVTGQSVTPALVQALRRHLGPALDDANEAALTQAALTAIDSVAHDKMSKTYTPYAQENA
ncbi:MAG: pseudouridine-5'-phosphate glycosidase [Pseudomonadota bacterium]